MGRDDMPTTPGETFRQGLAKLLAEELGLGMDWQDEQVRLYRELARGYLLD